MRDAAVLTRPGRRSSSGGRAPAEPGRDRPEGGRAGLSPGRRRGVLAVMCVALLLVVASSASLNVAVPDIQRSTGATSSELLWIVDVYTLVLAALLLPAGALGDRFGRRGALLVGLGLFAAASLPALWADSPGQLVVLRAVAGLGAALIMPATLSVITTIFPPQERGKAVGIWAGVAGAGGALGLVASGLLLNSYWWGSIFVLNLVLAAAAIIGTLAVVPRGGGTPEAVLDPVGALLAVLGVGALVLAIIEGPSWGWSSAATLGTFGAGVASLVAFVLWELRRARPMLDVRLFLLRGFGAGSLSLTVQFFAAFGFFYVSLLYLQNILGYGPLKASTAVLPIALVMPPLSTMAPRLADRVGIKVTAGSGLGLMAAGFAVLATLDVDSSYGHFLAGLLLFGVGFALCTAPATTAIVSSVPPQKQGVASAVNDTTREIGGALGIALMGSLIDSGYRDEIGEVTRQVPGDTADAVTNSLTAALQVAGGIGGERGEQLATAARDAFMHGWTLSLLVTAAVVAVGAIVVVLRAPGLREMALARSRSSGELVQAERKDDLATAAAALIVVAEHVEHRPAAYPRLTAAVAGLRAHGHHEGTADAEAADVALDVARTVLRPLALALLVSAGAGRPVPAPGGSSPTG